MSGSCDAVDCSPARLLCPWDSPGKNTGVDCHFLLQGDLPDPGIKPRSPALQANSLLTELRGNVYVNDNGASLVALVVMNPHSSSGDTGATGSIRGSGRSPAGGSGSPLQSSCLEHPMEPGRLQSIGSKKSRLNNSEKLRMDD